MHLKTHRRSDTFYRVDVRRVETPKNELNDWAREHRSSKCTGIMVVNQPLIAPHVQKYVASNNFPVNYISTSPINKHVYISLPPNVWSIRDINKGANEAIECALALALHTMRTREFLSCSSKYQTLKWMPMLCYFILWLILFILFIFNASPMWCVRTVCHCYYLIVFIPCSLLVICSICRQFVLITHTHTTQLQHKR